MEELVRIPAVIDVMAVDFVDLTRLETTQFAFLRERAGHAAEL